MDKKELKTQLKMGAICGGIHKTQDQWKQTAFENSFSS